MDITQLIEKIASGNSVSSAELLPFLCLESKEERCKVNIKLAEAYSQAGNIHQAKVFIARAWILSDFSADILGQYVKIHKALDDIDSIREAYKRIGMVKAKSGNLESALSYFYQSMYAYNLNQKGDYYEYDFDILEAIEGLAEPHRFKPKMNVDEIANRKIRLAYLVFGTTHLKSVIVKILCLFAEFHDKKRFEVVFFVHENELLVFPGYKTVQQNINDLMEYGGVVFVTSGTNQEDMLYETAKRLHDYQPDILITSALLADLKQYFIASLHPAPVMIGLLFGPPPQFAAPMLDLGISFTKHPLMDCPSNCSLVDLEIKLPEPPVSTADKSAYNIPDDSVVMVSAGRPTKFLDRDFWTAVIDLLRTYPNAFFVAIGLGDGPHFFNELIPEDLKSRFRFFGWLEDYIKILQIADIVIDTYPSGGGVVLMDAMALGKPFLSFKNNYMKIFDQTDWSNAEEYLEIPELLAERYDWEHFKKTASRLIEDKDFRQKMGDLCMAQINSRKGHPERMVQRCEEIYEKVIKQRASNQQFTDKDNTNEALVTSKDFYVLMEERVNFWKFNEGLYDKVHSMHQELQNLQQSKAVLFAKEISKYPLLTKLASFGYECLKRMHSWHGRK